MAPMAHCPAGNAVVNGIAASNFVQKDELGLLLRDAVTLERIINLVRQLLGIRLRLEYAALPQYPR